MHKLNVYATEKNIVLCPDIQITKEYFGILFTGKNHSYFDLSEYMRKIRDELCLH